MLADNDPQGSARDWNEENQGALFPVIGLDRTTIAKDLESIKENYDFVVIDGAPQLAKLAAAAVKASDFVLIPVQPSPYDIWATSDLVDLIKARQEITGSQPKSAFVVSRAIKGTKLSKEITQALRDYQMPVFKSWTTQRVDYPTSASNGCSVLTGDCIAKQEIQKITTELLETLKQ